MEFLSKLTLIVTLSLITSYSHTSFIYTYVGFKRCSLEFWLVLGRGCILNEIHVVILMSFKC